MTEAETETKKEKIKKAMHHFYLDKATIERFVALTTSRSMAIKERMRQKEKKIIDSIPIVRNVYHKADDFDKNMEAKHGQVYVKIRKSIRNITRTVLAAQMFGLPGVVGMCAYKVCESAAAFLEPAEKERQEGKVEGVFDYLKKNKEEAAVSTTNSALTMAATACEVVGAVGVEEMVRTGKASLLMGSELKTLGRSFFKWIRGKTTFKEVKRNAVVAGITFATYFASDAPMTRGSAIKPDENAGDKGKAPDNAKKEDTVSQILDVMAKQRGR